MNTTKQSFLESAADSVEGSVNVIAVGAGWVVEMIGNGLASLFDGFGGILSGIPGIGKFLRGLFHWLATIISALFDVPATALRGLLHALANGLGGLIRILGGLMDGITARDGRLLRKGVADFLSGISGAVVAVIAKLLALLQAIFFLQLGERPLSAKEKEILTRVYRGSVSLENIRLIEGFAGLFSANNRPFTLGNKIYMKHIHSDTDPATLVHEVCHVWQYQREGIRYIADALWAQWTVPDAYNWMKEMERGKTRWQEFNNEAQAQLIQDVYNSGRKTGPAHVAGEFYDDAPIHQTAEYKRKGVDYTELARAAVTFMRNKGKS